jgi:hypothetical protein
LHPTQFGTLHHTTHLPSKWGEDRGNPLDRYHIEQFLQQHRLDIRGRVLEVGQRKNADQSEKFDYLVLTQVLQILYNLRSWLAYLHHSLVRRSVLLAMVLCASRIDPDYGMEKDYWRFVRSACKTLFGETFGSDSVRVRAYGNVLVSIAFLAGVATERLSSRELDAHGETFQFLMPVQVEKK